jgi:hypothetical protein
LTLNRLFKVSVFADVRFDPFLPIENLALASHSLLIPVRSQKDCENLHIRNVFSLFYLEGLLEILFDLFFGLISRFSPSWCLGNIFIEMY